MAALDPISLIAMLNQGQQPGVPQVVSPILQSLLGQFQGQPGIAAPQQGINPGIRDRLQLLMQGLGGAGAGALR